MNCDARANDDKASVAIDERQPMELHDGEIQGKKNQRENDEGRKERHETGIHGQAPRNHTKKTANASVTRPKMAGPAQGNRVVPQSQESSLSLPLILPPYCSRGFSPYFSAPDRNVRSHRILRGRPVTRFGHA